MTKNEIRAKVEYMKEANIAAFSTLTDKVSISDYASQCREGEIDGKKVKVWTDAFNHALKEHEIIEIPANDVPYYIDNSIIVPSNRRIVAAEGAVIRQMPEVRVLLLRNEHVYDGTHEQTDPEKRDYNISIDGGRWEESWTRRLGYGKTGKYDEAHSYFGVSTYFLFSAVNNVSLTNMTFSHTAGFAVQIGNAANVWCENIIFDECFADGIHINGNTDNILVRNIEGELGDDIIAINMYDWLNSSINFGPMRTVLCENVVAYPKCYKAIRIAPGYHFFDDGSKIDCRAEDIYISNVRGLCDFKMYLQTPSYEIGEQPEPAGVGSGSNIYFENIDGYRDGKPCADWFPGFEIGAYLDLVSFENVNVHVYPDEENRCNLVKVGPKSWVVEKDGVLREIFDPYFNCHVKKLHFKNIRINGEVPEDIMNHIKIVKFDRIYDSDLATGEGSVGEVVYEK